ncbi:MAG: aldehyde dehydrogenase family protein [Spongiibacteraceae bacterium]
MSEIDSLFSALGLAKPNIVSGDIVVRTPIDGSVLGTLQSDDANTIDKTIAEADNAFRVWRNIPAPKRGELVRLYAEELRAAKETLARIVTWECGKILEEGRGEVQEMIDICDFAVGLSRQLYGLTISTERPDHRMMETWHPLSAIGVISAFNFPVAVWMWNAALALVCGDPVVWKPSEKTPYCALACVGLFEKAARRFGDVPRGLISVVLGGKSASEQFAADHRLTLISATGSCAMGRAIAPIIAARFGRSLLELGGNNAAIVAPSADLDLAVRAIVFSAAGTAGQRCTTLRRLIVHESIKKVVVDRLKNAYRNISIGNPLAAGNLVGPLIDRRSFESMQNALRTAATEGGIIFGGARVLAEQFPDAYYVTPAIVEMPAQTEIVRTEIFAPILYVMAYRSIEEAVALNNAVPQGLSSSLFTLDLREAEFFQSTAGSDCGIANINIGPSGAEIGGAFGGEKETGGGRESGSDSWKAYMRRATNTINYGTQLPLAQGIKFDI